MPSPPPRSLATVLHPSRSPPSPSRFQLDQTVSLALNQHPAASVALGNATVADVTVSDAHTLLITGKAFGTTNLLVLDRNGQTILSDAARRLLQITSAS